MNKPLIAAALLGLGLGLATLTAHAQIAYRCGNAYMQEPCPQARVVDVSDARTEAQRAEGARLAADDRRRADEMARERLAHESRAKPAPAKATKPKRPHVSKIKWFRP